LPTHVVAQIQLLTADIKFTAQCGNSSRNVGFLFIVMMLIIIIIIIIVIQNNLKQVKCKETQRLCEDKTRNVKLIRHGFPNTDE
jgi:uncharacterized membrane protein